MKIAIGSDHAGFGLKEDLRQYLNGRKMEVVDLGTSDPSPVDYPDIGSRVAEKISRGEIERGLLICGSGIGMSIVANRFPGVRAALCYGVEGARISREHNNANVLVLGARMTGKDLATEIVRVWLESDFHGGRHEERLNKIRLLEEKMNRGPKS